MPGEIGTSYFKFLHLVHMELIGKMKTNILKYQVWLEQRQVVQLPMI